MSTYYKPLGTTPRELTPQMIDHVTRVALQAFVAKSNAVRRNDDPLIGVLGFCQVEDASGNKLTLTIHRPAAEAKLRHTYRWNKDILEGRAVRRIHKLLAKD